MADQNSSQGRRPHFHRGRRGPDRRGSDRRTVPHTPEPQTGRDHVDVEQIMRDIRGRISQRHGIELSNQQIQELAARRLEAILEPRNVKPALFEQLRRSAAEPFDAAPVTTDGGYSFQEAALYDSDGGFLRAIRRLLHPILTLFLNPAPIAHALNVQAQINKDAATRDAARDRTQAEWNALHYEVLQRLVTEVSRVSVEMQSISMRIESLGAKVDFNERRVRAFEQSAHQGRPASSRSAEPTASLQSPVGGETPVTEGGGPAASAEGGSDASRRRRRRRRGRRGGGAGVEGAAGPVDAATGPQDSEEIDGEDSEGPDVEAGIGRAESEAAHEPAAATSPLHGTGPGASQPEASTLPAPAPSEPAAQAESPELPTQPAPPRDEPLPPAPVDHADPGPTDR